MASFEVGTPLFLCCKRCDYRDKRRDNLKRHYRKHHPEHQEEYRGIPKTPGRQHEGILMPCPMGQSSIVGRLLQGAASGEAPSTVSVAPGGGIPSTSDQASEKGEPAKDAKVGHQPVPAQAPAPLSVSISPLSRRPRSILDLPKSQMQGLMEEGSSSRPAVISLSPTPISPLVRGEARVRSPVLAKMYGAARELIEKPSTPAPPKAQPAIRLTGKPKSVLDLIRNQALSPVSVGSQGSSTSQEPADFGGAGDQPKANGQEQMVKHMKMARVEEKVYRNTYLDGRLVREEVHHQC